MELQRVKNVASRIAFPLIDVTDGITYFTGTAWGALTNAALTAYYSDAGADWTVFNPVLTGTPTEIGTLGEWKLLLSADELNHDQILIKLKADEILEQTILINTTANVSHWNGTAVATPHVAGVPRVNERGLYSGTSGGGTASTILLENGNAPEVDDVINGCMVAIMAGTGAGQSRIITDYDYNGDVSPSTFTASVEPNWTTNPGVDSVYVILPCSRKYLLAAYDAAKTAARAGDAMTLAANAVDTTSIKDGAITADKLGADCITNAKIADAAIAVENIKDAAITAAKLAGDCITNAKIADDAIAAENLATGAITSDALAASAVDEIWDEIQDGTITARVIMKIINALIAGDPTVTDNGDGTATVVWTDEGGSPLFTWTVAATGSRITT